MAVLCAYQVFVDMGFFVLIRMFVCRFEKQALPSKRIRFPLLCAWGFSA